MEQLTRSELKLLAAAKARAAAKANLNGEAPAKESKVKKTERAAAAKESKEKSNKERAAAAKQARETERTAAKAIREADHLKAAARLHPDLQDANLEAACELADKLTRANLKFLGVSTATRASDLSYMLEYLRLHFDLVPKK